MGRSMPRQLSALAAALMLLPAMLWATSASAQEQLPWQRGGDPRYQQPDDAYRPDPRYSDPRYDDLASRAGAAVRAHSAPLRRAEPAAGSRPTARRAAVTPTARAAAIPTTARRRRQRLGRSLQWPEPEQRLQSAESRRAATGNPTRRMTKRRTTTAATTRAPTTARSRAQGYSSNEILAAGHRFFGSISKGMASVIEYAFQQQGRPNGYILGQDAGGAFVAGLRYGEGTLYTRDAGTHRVYWQGPSIGWDAGAAGSKVMVLIYNLRDPEEIYQRFGGVDGSAYVVGGVGLTFQKSGDVVVAPIRAGVGLRLGANIGYLKYTRTPTWNPF